MIFIVSGPSGCGKSTIVRHILEDMEGVLFSVSHTSRVRREREEDGKDYHFVTRETFERMIEDEVFVEWAVVHGHYYGTSRTEIEERSRGADLLLDIDVQGAGQLRKTTAEAVFIFIAPPSLDELKRRLEGRGKDEAGSVRIRLEASRKEMRSYSQFDYIVINDELEKAVEDVRSIIRSTRCRLEVREKDILAVLQHFEEK